MKAAPSFLRTLRALAWGTAPRVAQGRGWVVAGLALAPVALSLFIATIRRMKGLDIPPGLAVQVYHEGLVKVMLPIMALVAAPAGIREDMEQRTLPLILARPAPAAALPLGKGLPWALWGALWLALSVGLLQLTGGDPELLLGRVGALVGAWWGELGFLTLLGLIFKRGALWGGIYLFVWEPFVRVFPPFLQRLTFVHHIESLAGSRGGSVDGAQLLAQEQVSTHPALAFTALLGFGLLCWALAGWKLRRTPLGLAGREAEG